MIYTKDCYGRDTSNGDHMKLPSSNELRESINNDFTAMRAKLAAMTTERDAALAKVALLWEALEGIEQFFSQQGETISEKFERIGEAFYKETHILRPGKDAPIYGQHTYEEREKAFDDWCKAKATAARNALEATK